MARAVGSIPTFGPKLTGTRGISRSLAGGCYQAITCPGSAIHGGVGRAVYCACLWHTYYIGSNPIRRPKVLRAYSSDGEHSVCTGEVEDSSPSRSTKFDWCLTCNDVRVKASRVARRKVEAR